MFELIKNMFIELWTDTVRKSNHKVRFIKQSKMMTQLTFINLHPNEYSQEFHYNLFEVKLERCDGIFNIFNDLSNKVCVPTKKED